MNLSWNVKQGKLYLLGCHLWVTDLLQHIIWIKASCEIHWRQWKDAQGTGLADPKLEHYILHYLPYSRTSPGAQLPSKMFVEVRQKAKSREILRIWGSTEEMEETQGLEMDISLISLMDPKTR